MNKARFEWDEEKDNENRLKHGVAFSLAQHAFLDPYRIIVEDVDHSADEESLLHWKCWRRYFNCKVHLQKQSYPHFRCRVLEKREENI
jgi:hypothetical protein